ncbi:MAG TPA: molybdopterin-guanine dinucleotide biosynthesis protein B [Roseiarcus sp.]|jgi:molybdopterin-guanine dinucleotide biosynthesis protein B|nr:molybdopterin-guanine dinucleotide biosynthesis protein B [Roseiarcus sp.]
MRVIGFAGWSGAGKTTLIVRLIPELNRRGFSVSTIKHAHHNFDLDQPGKDSYEHRAAGAEDVLVASANRVALMRELRGAPEPSLAELLRLLKNVDLVLVEGFKRDPLPKIEVFRAANGKPPLYPEDANIVALISTPFRLANCRTRRSTISPRRPISCSRALIRSQKFWPSLRAGRSGTLLPLCSIQTTVRQSSPTRARTEQ